MKPTADRGRAEGWMCLASDPPTRPELSRGTCEVWDGDRWTVQTCVTVLTAACAFESMLDVQIFCTEELKSLQVCVHILFSFLVVFVFCSCED